MEEKGKKAFLPAEASVFTFAKDSVIATSGNGLTTGEEDIEVSGGENKPRNR